jgi:hypothetical protein
LLFVSVSCELVADFSKLSAKIRLLNGVNHGPFAALGDLGRSLFFLFPDDR